MSRELRRTMRCLGVCALLLVGAVCAAQVSPGAPATSTAASGPAATGPAAVALAIAPYLSTRPASTDTQAQALVRPVYEDGIAFEAEMAMGNRLPQMKELQDRIETHAREYLQRINHDPEHVVPAKTVHAVFVGYYLYAESAGRNVPYATDYLRGARGGLLQLKKFED